MSASAKAVPLRGLKRRALSLSAVKAADHAMQALLPVILVRCLDAATFGQYRLLWLMVGTVMTVATFNMAGGLNFFLPRSDATRKRLYVHQTLLFMAASGLVCAALVGPWNGFLPDSLAPLQQYGALVPLFVALWVMADLLDTLPTVEERIRWQAYATVATSLLRTVLVGYGAWASGEFTVVLSLLIAVVVVKLAVLAAYIGRYHGFGAPWLDRAVFADQFRHVAPFGVAGALYALRGQADQWVAATLFALHSFAAFSVGAVLNSLVFVFRLSVVQAFLPNMSRLEAAGDVSGMMAMNSRGNVLVGMLVYPILAFVFAFAPEIVTVVYTAAYLEAAAVMRIYMVALAVLVIEVSSVLLLLRQGSFALGLNAGALALSVLVSWALGSAIGLPGAAAGSVIAVCLERTLTLRRIAACVGMPVRRLQDWRGLGAALGYAVVSAALIRSAADLLVEGSALPRLALGAGALALSYVPILLRWRAR